MSRPTFTVPQGGPLEDSLCRENITSSERTGMRLGDVLIGRRTYDTTGATWRTVCEATANTMACAAASSDTLWIGSSGNITKRPVTGKIVQIKDDTGRQPLGNDGDNSPNNTVQDMFWSETDGLLYCVGLFTATVGGDTITKVAAWDPVAETWTNMGSGLGTITPAAIIEYGGTVYLAGSQLAGGSFPNLLYNVLFTYAGGGNWTAVADTVTYTVGVHAIPPVPDRVAVHNGYVHVHGYLSGYAVLYWDGAAFQWYTLATNAIGLTGVLESFDGDLYAAAVPSAASVLYQWNGSTWASTGIDQVYDATDGGDGHLYVVGTFTSANSVANTYGVCRWDGSTTTSAGGIGASTYGHACYVAETMLPAA